MQRRVRLEDRVVADREVLDRIPDHGELSVKRARHAIRADVLKDIVLDEHAVRLLRDLTIRPIHRRPGCGLQNTVVAEGDVARKGPRIRMVLAARRDEKEEPRLRSGPMVAAYVALDQRALA